MRASFFYNSHNIELTIQGEKWNQGDFVAGAVSVDGREEILPGFNLELAFADLKNVRTKDCSKWKTLQKRPIEKKIFHFKLDYETPISDKSGSLFILLKDDMQLIGHLQLLVDMALPLKKFVDTFELFYRFKTQSIKNKKAGEIELKMQPPKSREFANIDHLLLSLKMVEENISLRYTFTVKALEVNLIQSEIKKSKKESEFIIPKKEYEMGPSIFNPECFKKCIDEALAKVAPKMLF